MDLRICILAAVQMESAAIAHGLHLPKHGAVELMWASEHVQLLTVGMHAVQLHALMPLVEKFGPRGVIVAGLGGALDPMLHVGDVVVDGPVNGEVPHVHLRRGRIHTADGLVGTAAAKSELFARTGALAVDMETAAVRRQLEKLPMAPTVLAVRAISDAADTAMDQELLGLVDALGKVRVGAVARLLARRPGAITQLMGLRRDARRALGALRPVVAALVKAPELWMGAAAAGGGAGTG